MSLMTELVKRLALRNTVRGENVECPECGESIKSDQQKVVAANYVRCRPCHLSWRHNQGYQGDPEKRKQANLQTF